MQARPLAQALAGGRGGVANGTIWFSLHGGFVRGDAAGPIHTIDYTFNLALAGGTTKKAAKRGGFQRMIPSLSGPQACLGRAGRWRFPLSWENRMPKLQSR